LLLRFVTDSGPPRMIVRSGRNRLSVATSSVVGATFQM
jgi:hypothetical protein